MKKILSVCAVLFCLVALKAANNTDTAAKKVVDGYVWTKHKVVKGETFYALSKKYGTTVEKIQTVNNSKNLTVNTYIYVPTKEKATVSNSPTPNSGTNTSPTPKNAKIHIVTKGETLSAIARKYNVTVEELKKANQLTSDNLKLDQKLTIPEKGNANGTASNSNPVDIKPVETDTPQTKPSSTVKVPDNSDKPIVVVANADRNGGMPVKIENQKDKAVKKEQEEKGIIKSNDSKLLEKTKMQILHPTIPEGNIIVIVNPSNNEMAYCRVVGKFDPATNDNAAVLASNAVLEKLHINNKTGGSVIIRFAY